MNQSVHKLYTSTFANSALLGGGVRVRVRTSLQTHRYANRAKNIKNKPRINEDPKDALLREYQEEILRLKGVLDKRKRKGGGGRKRGRKRATSEGEGGLDW